MADVDVDSGLRYGPMVTDERLGPDRSVACVAAMEKYGRPVIVLDFGTATTVDAVGEDGVYQGGCISRRASGDHGRADGQRRHAAQRGAE